LPAPAEQLPAPTERWTTRRVGGESPDRAYPPHGGPPRARNILIVSRQRAQGRCFSDLRHSEALEIFHGSSSLQKTIYHHEGATIGGCFIAEGPVRRNTFGRSAQKQRRSYHPGSFGIATRLETKGCIDLKRKRPVDP
jgi:hypothetical protein